jgi:endoglucanase
MTAIAAPNHQVPDVRYSFDAHRVISWFATGGDEASDLAAKWSALLDDTRGRASALALDGTVIDGNAHPTALVAAAAAASAAGQEDVRDRRLTEAESLDAEHPTYYGSAWIALGRALLTTDLVG